MQIPKIQELFKCVCVLGGTGTGKSASCKTITGIKTNDVFKPSSSLSSVTFETKGIMANWFGDKTKEKIFVIDTPGFGDSDGKDTLNIAKMVCAL